MRTPSSHTFSRGSEGNCNVQFSLGAARISSQKTVMRLALRHYREQAGAAGALFGLSYYLLLGMMLGVAGMVQQLGLVLSVCALLAWICSLRRG